jgi:hypothetical protein
LDEFASLLYFRIVSKIALHGFVYCFLYIFINILHYIIWKKLHKDQIITFI